MLALRTSAFDLFEHLEQELARVERVPAAEIRETDEAFLLTLELPGIPRNAIEIKATDRRLVVTAERKAPAEKDGLRSEFRYGTWSRSFSFGKGINPEKLEAHHRDGLLAITAPKAEAIRSVTIKVQD